MSGQDREKSVRADKSKRSGRKEAKAISTPEWQDGSNALYSSLLTHLQCKYMLAQQQGPQLTSDILHICAMWSSLWYLDSAVMFIGSHLWRNIRKNGFNYTDLMTRESRSCLAVSTGPSFLLPGPWSFKNMHVNCDRRWIRSASLHLCTLCVTKNTTNFLWPL